MNMNRRDLLKRGLFTAGAAVATGTAGGAAIEAINTASKTPAAGTQPAGAVTPALTPDGKLVHLCDGKVVKHSLPVLSNAAVRTGIPGRKWVMVIDLAKCDGCKKCTEACSKCHFTPSDREWIKVFRMQDSPHTAPYFFPKPCFHCDNPPCTKVCPVDATFKRQDGIVLIDNERCIGCRFCMAACPYSTRFFNWEKPQNPPEALAEPYSPERGYPRRVGTVEKCDFCPEMAAAGKLPHCVAGCPMAAIYYGDQNEDAVTNSRGETERLSKLLKDRAGYRYLEELGTEPRLYYLPPKSRMFPGPSEPGEHGHSEHKA
jgi:molybdopterin-containing oxidoreductase family iron-sulfur binding subunit